MLFRVTVQIESEYYQENSQSSKQIEKSSGQVHHVFEG